jgi:hypothetical protein
MFNVKILQVSRFQIFSDLVILEHTCLEYIIYVGTKSTHEINASYTPYIHSLRLILHNIFNSFVHETKFNYVEFFACGTILVLTTLWMFDFRFLN